MLRVGRLNGFADRLAYLEPAPNMPGASCTIPWQHMQNTTSGLATIAALSILAPHLSRVSAMLGREDQMQLTCTLGSCHYSFSFLYGQSEHRHASRSSLRKHDKAYHLFVY